MALLLAGCSVVGIRSGTEEPAYSVVGQVGTVQIRNYAPRLAASVTVQDDEVPARSDGFRRLARFIFGGNAGDTAISMTAPVAQAAGNRIAMTAPVAQQPGPAGSWVISFFMPAKYTLATLPRPLDPGIQIHTVPAQLFAVLRFSGIPGSGPVAAARTRLTTVLATSEWVPTGAPEMWFYDPPWTLPFARRNEVAVPVAAK